MSRTPVRNTSNLFLHRIVDEYLSGLVVHTDKVADVAIPLHRVAEASDYLSLVGLLLVGSLGASEGGATVD